MYDGFTKEEIISGFQSAFESASAHVKKSKDRGIVSARTALQRALEANSAKPVMDEVDRGSSHLVSWMYSVVMSAVTNLVEQKSRYNLGFYSLCGDYAYYLEKSNTKHLAETSKAFIVFNSIKNSVESNVLDIPYLIQNKIVENFDIFIQFPHRSVQDPTMLCFYRTIEDLARDKKTTIKPGKWFMSNKLGIEKEALEFSQAWAASAIIPPKVFFLSELKDNGGISEDNWEWVYRNTSQRTGSCMIKVPEIARVYADNPVLDLAYITSTDEPFSGSVIARSIIRHDTKKYIRTYQENHKVGGYFEGALKEKGFSEKRSLEGVSVKRITKGKDRLIMPYFDGEAQRAILSETEPNKFIVTTRLPERKKLRNIESYSGTSSGSVPIKARCKHCGAISEAYQFGYVKSESKKIVQVENCHFCCSSFLYCYPQRKSFSLDDFKFFFEYDSRENIFCANPDLGDGKFKIENKITCKYTKAKVRFQSLNAEFENKNGEAIEDINSVFLSTDPIALEPVKTITGEITESTFTKKFSSDFYNSFPDDFKAKFSDRYCWYDVDVRAILTDYVSDVKKKKSLLNLLLKRNLITEEERLRWAPVPVVSSLDIVLIDNESKMVREYDEEEGEITYNFNLSSQVQDLIAKSLIQETEVVIDELDKLIASFNPIEVVMF